MTPKFLELATTNKKKEPNGSWGKRIILCPVNDFFLGIHQMAPLCYKQPDLTSAFQYRGTFAKVLILEMSILK